MRVENPDFAFHEERYHNMSRRLQRLTNQAGWNDTSFWAWDRAAAERVIERFAETNAKFAQEVWEREWPEQPDLDRAPNMVRIEDFTPDQASTLFGILRDLPVPGDDEDLFADLPIRVPLRRRIRNVVADPRHQLPRLARRYGSRAAQRVRREP